MSSYKKYSDGSGGEVYVTDVSPGSTLLDILSSPPITRLAQRRREPEPSNNPPVGNIGNCQGQVTVTYYVYDSPVVET